MLYACNCFLGIEALRRSGPLFFLPWIFQPFFYFL